MKTCLQLRHCPKCFSGVSLAVHIFSCSWSPPFHYSESWNSIRWQNARPSKFNRNFCKSRHYQNNSWFQKSVPILLPATNLTRTEEFIRCDFLVVCFVNFVLLPSFLLWFWCHFCIFLDFLLVHVKFRRHRSMGNDLFSSLENNTGQTDQRTDTTSYRDT